VQDDVICVMRMASCNDFLSQHAPIRERCLRVAVIMQAIASTAFSTVQGTAGIMHQRDFGRTSADFDCFRMHASDYSVSWLESNGHGRFLNDGDLQQVISRTGFCSDLISA
jgi:hypothetical protein